MDIGVKKIKSLLISTPKALKVTQLTLSFIVVLYLIMQPLPDIKYLYLAILVYFIQGCMGITALYYA